MKSRDKSFDRRFVLAALAWLAVGGLLSGADDEKAEEALVKKNAATLAGQIAVERQASDGWSSVGRMAEPALYYGDPTRNNSNGSVWIWGDSGRPVSIMELYQPSDRPDDWVFVVNNLSGGVIRAQRKEQLWWRENESAVEWKQIGEADPVASAKPQRLLQLKALARRFKAHEFWDPNNSRFELRQLSQALHRFADEEHGLIDGGVFAFSNGTNPEVILLLEAKSEGGAEPRWQYALARLGHAEMHVAFDDVEVWTVPRVDRMASTEPYWLHYENIPNIE
jgi:hypothetical protein